jgi:DNA-binding response OmpR family regulator
MSATVLVVDDDADLRALLTFAFTDAGYEVVEAASGAAAIAVYRARKPDVVILDIGLGDIDGVEVCRTIRAHGNTPIVFVTSRSDEADQLLGFEAGADDYVTKPFSPKVLVAHVTSVLRRGQPAAPSAPLLESDGVALDADGRTVTVHGAPLDTTKTEFDVLQVLMENPRRVVPRGEIVERVWGPWFGDDHVLEVHISRLRTKVLKAGGPRIAVAVRGVGYRLSSGNAPA